VEDIGNDREVKIESEREIRVIGRERDTEENRDESDVNIDVRLMIG
jgi:hypothetical protein